MLLALGVGLLLLILWWLRPGSQADAAPVTAPAALTVNVTEPARQTWPDTIEVDGSLAAWQEAVIGAETGSLRITALYADVGSTVKRGQLLALLADGTATAEVRKQEGAVAQARATVEKAQADLQRSRMAAGSGALSGQKIDEYRLAAASDRFVGGLRLPGDETGDCHLFTTRLANHLAKTGVEFRFSTAIAGIDSNGAAVTGVRTDAGVIRGDAYLVALGSHSPQLVRPLGIHLPVYPVKGYSITVPIANPAAAPISTLLDESYKIAITRLGDRIRVGGMAEISGYDNSLPARREATLLHSLNDLFPGAAQPGPTSFWSGLRPMTPDGPPIIGGTALPNLFLSTGHGTLGWTMACGSAAVIAAIIGGKTPPIPVAGLGLDRYRG